MIIKWNPNSIFRDFNSMANEFSRFHREVDRNRMPAVYSGNSFEWMREEDVVTVSAELPGYSDDNIEIALEAGNRLTVSGERHAPQIAEGERYLRHERRSNSFSRSFKLPFNIDSDSVEASYSDGMLMISLPRAETDKPRQIAVNAA